jgi:hypothetical protein
MERKQETSFEFFSDNDASVCQGTVILRDGEMVLDVLCDGEERPYTVVGASKGHSYIGRHVGPPGDSEVTAEWVKLADAWVGVWVEDGHRYLFTFQA